MPTPIPTPTSLNYIKDMLPFVSIIISIVLPLIILRKTKYIENKPDIRVSSISIYPGKMEIYAGEHVILEGKREIPQEYLKEIECSDRANSHSVTSFGKLKYVFINMCNEATPKEDIILILNAINITLEIDRVSIKELLISKLYCITDTDELFPADKINVNVDSKLIDEPLHKDSGTKSLLIAYACPYASKNKSTLLEKLNSVLKNLAIIANSFDESEIRLYDKKSEISEIPETPIPIKNMLAFTDTGYLLRCRVKNKNYYLSLHLWIDNDEKLIASIDDGATEFRKGLKKNRQKTKNIRAIMNKNAPK